MTEKPAAHGGRVAILALVLGVALAWFFLRSPAPDAAAVRNVVLISVDTLRADHLGCYGDARATTPQIDGLAAAGVRFERAQAPVPLTLPSHATILTGLRPPAHGARGNTMRLEPGALTLAEILSARGMSTAAFVGAAVLRSAAGLSQGFDVYDDDMGGAPSAAHAERPAAEVSRRATAWLEANHARPFFLFLHYFDPHYPYSPPEPFASRGDDPYAGEIAYTDEQVGRVLDALQALGHAEDTLVIFTADHGESRGEHDEPTHGWFVYQSTLRVPLIIRGPGVSPGRVVSERVGLVDILPTVLARLSAEPPPAVHGLDLSGALSGDGAAPTDRSLYAECLVPTDYGVSPLFALGRGDHQYIHTARPELYDLARDLAEARDLIEREPARAAAMRAELAALVDGGGRQTEGTVDPGELEMLRALGYTTGGAVDARLVVDDRREDPKDFFPFFNQRTVIRGHLAELRAAGAPDEAARARLADVRRRADALVEARPDQVVFRTLLAEVASMQGDRVAAAEQLTAAVALTPEDDTLREQLVRFLLAHRAEVDAPALLARAIEASDRAQLRHAAAIATGEAGDVEAARAHLARALELGAPPRLRVDLGVALARGGQTDAAIEELTAAVEADPSAERPLGALVTTLLEAGRLTQAQERVDHLVQLRPGPGPQVLLARVLLARGDASGALEALARAEATSPPPPVAARIAELRAQVAGAP